MTESLPFTPLFIDGKQVPYSAGSTFQVYNPFTESVVGTCATATSDDCTAALQSAAKAFPAWEATPLAKRQEIVSRAADIFEEEATKNRILDAGRAETAATDASINGLNKVIAEFMRANIEYSMLMDQVDSSPSVRVQGAKVEVRRRAMGVVLAISPWNAPVFLSIRAITIPLLCGNTVILKSSEYTPRSQAIVAEVFHQAGVPPGVLNYISMTREASPALTAQLIAHPAVRKINFTGSKRVGTIIATEAAKHLKPCVLELGGKSPALVLADANIALAARAIVLGAFTHSGQICMSTCRVIVQRAISEELIQQICELAGTWKAGGPGEERIQSGVLFTQELAGSVVGLIQEAKNMGARIVLGDGKRVRGVVQPHVLVLDGMEAEPSIWKEESFGPELVIRTFDDLEEGIALANDSDYTLSSSLWTENKELADSVPQRIRAGYVNVNGSTIHSESKYGLMGLGGSSGYGRFGVDDFTDRRVTVYHPT